MQALTDDKQIATKKNLAVEGLEQLQAYTGMDRTADSWQVSLKGPAVG